MSPLINSPSSTAEETESSHWWLHQCNQIRRHVHQGLLEKSSVVSCTLIMRTILLIWVFYCWVLCSLWPDFVWPCAVTWTQSSMKRLYGIMKKFTRQKKHQVSSRLCRLRFTFRSWFISWSCFHTLMRLGFHFDSSDHKHLLKNAQLQLKKSKRKDYYKVLGVGKNATEDEIKKAYRKRALMHHPGNPVVVFLTTIPVLIIFDVCKT